MGFAALTVALIYPRPEVQYVAAALAIALYAVLHLRVKTQVAG